ncbi:MAG: hypothetical protein K0S54_1128 [Alphaproteobacteria bacterium]|jgi:hypothetical protein|nr:hypothetical protein [Alphaproteobacteria bacterium]
MALLINTNNGKTSHFDLTRQANLYSVVYAEYTFTGTPTLGDLVELFPNGSIQAWQILHWALTIDGQVDTNATPTVAFDLGVTVDNATIVNIDGRMWQNNITTLGRTAGGSKIVDTTGRCMKQNGLNGRLVLRVAADAATPAWTGKTVNIIIWLGPAIQR